MRSIDVTINKKKIHVESYELANCINEDANYQNFGDFTVNAIEKYTEELCLDISDNNNLKYVVKEVLSVSPDCQKRYFESTLEFSEIKSPNHYIQKKSQGERYKDALRKVRKDKMDNQPPMTLSPEVVSFNNVINSISNGSFVAANANDLIHARLRRGFGALGFFGGVVTPTPVVGDLVGGNNSHAAVYAGSLVNGGPLPFVQTAFYNENNIFSSVSGNNNAQNPSADSVANSNSSHAAVFLSQQVNNQQLGNNGDHSMTL